MGVKVATTCLQWSSQPIVPHSPSSQTLASAISSPSKKRSASDGAALVCRFFHRSVGSPATSKLYRSRSCEYPKSRGQTIKRACSASLDAFSDEEFSKKIQELALRFQLSDDDGGSTSDSEQELVSEDSRNNQIESSTSNFCDSQSRIQFPASEPPWAELRQEPPGWPGNDEIIPLIIERKANSVDIPLSLRIIKKKQWQEGFVEAGESAYCSIKKAFSSMVFIIRELQSFTLQMRETLLVEDLQGILARVQKEMNASFVWLFQQVFSHTPTLMVYVMILLANFTVHSMATNTAIAASPPLNYQTITTETESVTENQTTKPQQFDSSAIKSFSVSSSTGKATSIGGINGGGGKTRPVASAPDGDGLFESSDVHGTILPDETSQVSSIGNPTTQEDDTREEELRLWDSMVDEAYRMQQNPIDHETMHRFVSPVTASMESDDYSEYFRTEILYQTTLIQEPHNALFLANYAQFLYLVAQDYDRAEEYFKRAIELEPADAEAYTKYATFLWRIRKDLWAAEETYLEAISAEPTNSFYAANYAHFLWSTGGEDTCFPLSSPDTVDA